MCPCTAIEGSAPNLNGTEIGVITRVRRGSYSRLRYADSSSLLTRVCIPRASRFSSSRIRRRIEKHSDGFSLALVVTVGLRRLFLTFFGTSVRCP